jgi:hypothetical protein
MSTSGAKKPIAVTPAKPVPEVLSPGAGVQYVVWIFAPKGLNKSARGQSSAELARLRKLRTSSPAERAGRYPVYVDAHKPILL